MARVKRPSYLKRQKEQARLARARAKQEDRLARRRAQREAVAEDVENYEPSAEAEPEEGERRDANSDPRT